MTQDVRNELAQLVVQQPEWPDRQQLADVERDLARLPGLVLPAECDVLKQRVAAAARGEAFWLQGGDCAETFAGVSSEHISATSRTLLQMALILTYGASLPVVKVGRIAGQYAKPRSEPTETRGGITLPSYRGDAVNDITFTAQGRRPDPARLLQMYRCSAATLNHLRASVRAGDADLRRVHEWNAGFASTEATARYESLAAEIDRAMRFLRAVGADAPSLHSTEMWVSHEALLLEYERGLTRLDERSGAPYGTSGHFLWIGERTRRFDGAHVEFMARIRNPIGVKLGPSASPDDVLALVERLNRDREPGRLTFVTRMGAGLIRSALPPLVDAARRAGGEVLWVCDPMHGNTFTSHGVKTRRLDDVVDEIRGFFEVHRQMGTVPGGVHVELAGKHVTECVGGADRLDGADLAQQYESACDPRLNHRQSLELAFLVAEALMEG